jgi:hypothetical protein
MTRLRRGVPAVVAFLALAAFAAAPAAATTVKHRHVVHAAHVRALPRSEAFPVYVDHGSDRNPGGDDLYFNDTKVPHYIVGPAWFQRWDDQ